SPTAAAADGRQRTCCIPPRAASARLPAGADRVRFRKPPYALLRKKEPDERKPELAGIGDGAIVDEHVGQVRAAHYLKHVLQSRRVARQKSHAITMRGPVSGFAKIRRAAR